MAQRPERPRRPARANPRDAHAATRRVVGLSRLSAAQHGIRHPSYASHPSYLSYPSHNATRPDLTSDGAPQRGR